MKQSFWLCQILAIILSFFLFISFFAIEPAYSRGGGGCFSRGTLILTPEGSKTNTARLSSKTLVQEEFRI